MRNGKFLHRAFTLLAAVCVPLVGAVAASAQINIATVPVGNPGNTADATGFGSVPYTYNIGKYDVTSSQYTAFLSAVAASDPFGVYNSAMAGTTNGLPGIVQGGSAGSHTYSVINGRGNYPVTDVSFWDATRFTNWLENGQPTGPEGPGTTETGTYALSSEYPANSSVTRNANSIWSVASENEWYKAAYYDPGTGGYSPYPTQSGTISTTLANYNDLVGDTTPVGSYAFPSYCGTYDQGGDVNQWNDSIYSSASRVVRGGSFINIGSFLQSSSFTYDPPTQFTSYVGFRVSEVPEPASLAMLAFGGMGMLARRRRS